jgi:hypothetical protein
MPLMPRRSPGPNSGRSLPLPLWRSLGRSSRRSFDGAGVRADTITLAFLPHVRARVHAIRVRRHSAVRDRRSRPAPPATRILQCRIRGTHRGHGLPAHARCGAANAAGGHRHLRGHCERDPRRAGAVSRAGSLLRARPLPDPDRLTGGTGRGQPGWWPAARRPVVRQRLPHQQRQSTLSACSPCKHSASRSPARLLE